MANARLLERLLPAMAAEAGISVAELRELMIPVDMDTTADVSSAEDDVSDVEIDADDGAASPPASVAPARVRREPCGESQSRHQISDITWPNSAPCATSPTTCCATWSPRTWSPTVIISHSPTT